MLPEDKRKLDLPGDMKIFFFFSDTRYIVVEG
jgi:hypothetical protein